ncbi:MAG: SLC13 family permease [Tenuifilaceae bacterium]|nr:SLC13 family permease [Tenuifilaceae bacterium]
MNKENAQTIANDNNAFEHFDPLDMQNYRIEKLPKRAKGKFEKWLAEAGVPLAIVSFILLAFVVKLPFLSEIDPEKLISSAAQKAYATLGADGFMRTNVMMLAIFAASLILWITEAIPNYLTSLILIITLILTNVIPEKEALAQLGHPVMWLNIMSFVLASMLVATGVAKRFALWFIIKFGKSAGSIFISFIIINLILSAFISATTAKAAILLPIFMVIASIYGAHAGTKNNFGRSIVLQNLLNINIGAGISVTGSGANLLAAALIGGAIGGKIYFGDWLMAMFPIVIGTTFIGYVVAMKIFFPLSPKERLPQIEGGMERLKEELRKLGKIDIQEIKAIILFVFILGFWATDRIHGISATSVAFVGAIIALLPRIGIINWNDVDIPWHLMLFSAGAYTLGTGLDFTDLPSITVNAIFDDLGIGTSTPFWVLYIILTGMMLFSSIIFQSKTMRTMIFIPISIGVANRFGFSIVSLALPVAFLINHVYVLPFNSKPAALLYETDHYSIADSFKYGFAMMVISWLLIIVAGETWFRFLGITPNGVLGFF